jgi:hypothetical protein
VKKVKFQVEEQESRKQNISCSNGNILSKSFFLLTQAKGGESHEQWK